MTEITKDDPRFDVVLNMDDEDFGEKLVEAIGAKPGEKIEIVTPQFDRTDGKKITYLPSSKDEYQAIRLLDKEGRKAIGMGLWSDEDPELWLFPAEWYAHIPAGTEIVDICGDTEHFILGKTDDDRRFGALAFGFEYAKSSDEDKRGPP